MKQDLCKEIRAYDAWTQPADLRARTALPPEDLRHLKHNPFAMMTLKSQVRQYVDPGAPGRFWAYDTPVQEIGVRCWTMATTLPLADLAESWGVELKAGRKSPLTIRKYLTNVGLYLDWCDTTGRPAEITRPAVLQWLADLVDAGRADTTIAAAQQAVRLFSAWLAAEGERDDDPLVGMKKPKLDERVVQPYTADELKRLLAACSGRDFLDRRDEAMVRVLCESGIRSFELLSMTVEDVDARRGTAVIKGKGSKERVIPVGPATARAIDRYLRARRTHKLADRPELWLGARGKPLGYAGLRYTLKDRAEVAGLAGFHPHRLRHTFADRWLDAGGSEGGLMNVAGWSDPTMIRRYSRARQAARAVEESKRLGLGDL